MAKSMIDIDSRQLKKWGDYTKLKRPSQAIAIIRGVLNDQAFSTQKQAKKNTIPNMFHNRTSWIASSIMVNKASGKDPKKLRSETGAAKRWKRNPSRDFMGMKDQEYGRNIRRPNIHTEWSRGGIFSKNVKPSLRANKLGSAKDVSGSTSRVISLLRKLDKDGYKGSMYIKSSRFKKGVYKFSGRRVKARRGKKKIRPIQMVIDKSQSSATVKRKPWLTRARSKAVTQQTTMRFFKRQWERYTKK